MTRRPRLQVLRVFGTLSMLVLGVTGCARGDDAASTDQPSVSSDATEADAQASTPTGANGATAATGPSASAGTGAAAGTGASGPTTGPSVPANDPAVIVERFVNEIAEKSNKMLDERAKICIFDKLIKENTDLWKAAANTPYLELPPTLRVAINNAILGCIPSEIAEKLPQI